MRLFIAVLFEENIKDELEKCVLELKTHSARGNFSRRENLHLTLVFIGEIPSPAKIISAMDDLKAEPFELKIGGLGRFRRQGGDIYWLGIEKSKILDEIYQSLYQSLTLSGLRLENREFKPHLTLGREVVFPSEVDPFQLEFFRDFPALKVNVSRISLMKSERIQGKLTYTEIAQKKL